MTERNHESSEEDREDVTVGAEDQSAPTGAEPEESVLDEDISHLEEQLSDIDIDEDEDELTRARKELDQLGDDLARARADHYNLTQQYNNYVRRSKTDVAAARGMGREDVIEALMPVLDDIEAARAAGALTDGPFAAIATKFESTLATRYEFERFGVEGEEFDPAIHEAVLATPSADVDTEQVQQVIQHGYKTGEKVLRPAKVIVAKPE
ncbi:MAG: nucleotide exchange factor GrpE [Actinomycetaceae bacterium]|nr:nucleotide exchange factor GrpE [Actinomycetaceae bacterium]